MTDNSPIGIEQNPDNEDNEAEIQVPNVHKTVRGSYKDNSANATLQLRSAMMEVLEENVRAVGVKAELTAFLDSPRGKEMVFYLLFSAKFDCSSPRIMNRKRLIPFWTDFFIITLEIEPI